MRSEKSRLFFLGVFLAGILLSLQSLGIAETADTGSQKIDLGDIKSRLTALDAGQKEILANQVKILAELDRIRVWVHRK